MTSLPPSAYISDADGSFYGNKAYFNTLTVVGNTQQSGVGTTPVVMTPSLAAANTFTYSYVANNVVSFQPVYAVIQDAAGRARIGSDLNVIGNVTASQYNNLPTYTPPANVISYSTTSNVGVFSNLVANVLTANAGTLGTLQYLRGNGQTLTIANTVQANTVQVGTLSSNTSISGPLVTASQISPLSNLLAINASSIFLSGNVSPQLPGSLGLAQLSTPSLTGQVAAFGALFSNAANVSGSVVANAVQSSTVLANSITSGLANVTTILANSFTTSLANCNTLLANSFTSSLANISTLFVSNLQGVALTPANLVAQTLQVSGLANVANLTSNTVQVLSSLQVPFANVGNTVAQTLQVTGQANLAAIYTPLANCQTIFANNVTVQSTLSTLSANVTGNLFANTIQSGNLTSNSVSVTGASILGARSFTTFPLTVQSNIGAFTQFCTVTDPQNAGTYNIKLALVQSRGYNAVLKTYNLAFTFSYMPYTWQRCLPEYNTGPANNNDFALDVISYPANAAVTFRAVRTAVGTMINSNLTAHVSTVSDTGFPITVSPNNITGLNANNTGLYAQAPLSINQGNIAILTENPQYPFDVNTSMRVGGALTANSIICSNIQGLQAQANLTNTSGNSFSYLFGNVGNLTSLTENTTTINVSGNAKVQGILTGNVANVNVIGAQSGNVISLGASTIFCSNIQGYNPAQQSLTDIGGNSSSYFTVKAGTITANTSVGILTPTPAFPLDVAGTGRTSINTSTGRGTALRIENLGSSAGGATIDMASQFGGLAQPNKIAGQMYAEPDTATGGRIVLATSSTTGALTTAVNINALQQVGINTGNPQYQLDVNGQARFMTNQVWHQANAPGFYIGNALSANQSGFLTFNNAGPPSGPGALGLGVFGVGGLTVSGTGNVGVQQSQPAYMFDVGGPGRIPTLLSSNVTTSAVSIPGSSPINFAYDNTTKDPNAGVIGYQRFSGSCLDIIGAGTGPPNRAVRIWETLGVGMNPSYPLDISGTGRIPTLLTGGGTISASNPYISVAGGGDLIGLKFSAAADRYGLALNGGVTRVITSGVNATAQVGLSLASTDGPGASATGFTDLLYASNSGVTVTRPFTAQTANVSTLFCSNIVGYSPAQAANLTNITGNSANYAQVTAGNVVVQGNVNAAAGSFTGNITVQGSETVNGSLSVYGSQGISQNLSVYGSQGLLVQSSSSTPVQLVSTNGGAGNPVGIGLSTFLGRTTPACQVVALDDGSASAHLLLSTANPGTSNNATERVRVTSSGNVGFNQSSPQYLVHAQPNNTDVAAINPDAYNPLMVYEDCTRSTLAQGSLSGSASYTAGNGYVVLTQAATSQSGYLNYPINPGTAFDVTAELFVGTAGNSTYPADGFSFYCYNNGATNVDLYQNTVASGYVLGFSDYASANVARGSTTPAYSVMLWWNGTLLASQSYTAYSVPLNAWTQLRISFVRNVWRVWLGTTQVINFQDVSRTLVGSGTSLMGFGGQTGGYWAAHLIRNIQITKHVQGPWRPATGGNVSGIQYNGVVNVAGNLAVTGSTVVGTAATDTSIGASAAIVNRVANVSYVLPNQGTTFTSSTGGTQSYVYTDYNYPSQTGSSPGGRMFINDSNYSTDFRWQSKAPGAFGNSLVERLTITSQGLVGINQSVPQYTCDVNGQLRTTGHAYVAGNAYITGPIVQNLQQDPGEFIYSKYVAIGDRYGIGQWPAGKTRVFCSSTFAPAFCAFSCASTDTLGPSGSNFQDLLVAGNTYVNINRPLTVASGANVVTFIQGTGYQNLVIGNTQSTAGSGFLSWNNPTSPGYTNSLGIGVYGAPGGITCSPNGSVGISQTQPSASTSLDIYGVVRAQLNNVSQTYINSGGSYTISGGSALTNSTIWNPITFGNQNSIDVTSALWATNATFWTIPVNGVYHLSFDGTASATNTFAGYWTFNRLGGSSTNASNLKLGPSTCTNNLYLHSNFTMYLQAGDQPQFVFASGSTGAFNTNGASVRIVLLNRC